MPSVQREQVSPTRPLQAVLAQWDAASDPEKRLSRPPLRAMAAWRPSSPSRAPVPAARMSCEALTTQPSETGLSLTVGPPRGAVSVLICVMACACLLSPLWGWFPCPPSAQLPAAVAQGRFLLLLYREQLGS